MFKHGRLIKGKTVHTTHKHKLNTVILCLLHYTLIPTTQTLHTVPLTFKSTHSQPRKPINIAHCERVEKPAPELSIYE